MFVFNQLANRTPQSQYRYKWSDRTAKNYPCQLSDRCQAINRGNIRT
ncbi:hypothetical protein [Brunnivagina elsteri]|nr:hypothetical protein [Calothrix elsteri]